MQGSLQSAPTIVHRVLFAVRLNSNCKSVPAIAPLDTDLRLEPEPQAVSNLVTLVKTSLMPMVAVKSRTTPSSTLGTVPQNSLPAKQCRFETLSRPAKTVSSSAMMAHACQHSLFTQVIWLLLTSVTTLHVASGLRLHKRDCKSNPVVNMADELIQHSPGRRTRFPKLGMLTGFQATVPVI